jgi:hypothetical protein
MDVDVDVDADWTGDVRVMAIDPGVTGALAVISYINGELRVEAVYDLPTWSEKTSSGKTRRHVDPVALLALVRRIGPVDRVICERLTAPPGIASTVAFSLGATAATVAAVMRIAKVSYKLVSPVIWKRALDVPADKEAARKHASRLFKTSEPWERKKDHNRAEAALIGAYGALAA